MEWAARLWLSIPLVALLACGGRYGSNRHDEASGSAGSPASGDACELQTEAYAVYRDELIAQYSSFGCMQASDCLAFYIQNGCDDSCQLTVTGARRAVVDGLNNYAASSCNDSCFPYPKPDCGAPPAAVCSYGHCAIVK